MLVFIAILIIVLILELFFVWWTSAAYIRTAVKELSEYQRIMLDKLNQVQTEVNKKGSVTDPFKVANRTHGVGSPTSHIVPRNSPDYIRNKNADSIKAGLGSYGNPE